MEVFLGITLLSIVAYALCVCYIIMLSSKTSITEDTVLKRVLFQYLCSTLLIIAIISVLLHLQAVGIRLMGIRSEADFITDLCILGFLASIVIAYNIKLIRNFCDPVYRADSIPEIDQFFLYLRPFESDRTSFEKYIKCISWESYGALAIANPEMIIQKTGGDSLFATDEEWKKAVRNSMKKSKFNVIHVGNTNGCLWELEQCLDSQIEKTIFVASDEEGYSVLRNFLIEFDRFIYCPKLPQNGCVAFFMRKPDSLLSWDNTIIQNKKDAERLIHDFISTRPKLDEEIKIRKEGLRRPLSSLFKGKYFPKSIGLFSWAWLSIIIFTFVGRLRPIYITLIISLFLGAVVLSFNNYDMGAYIIYGISAFIGIFGKRMMWLSSQWTGGLAISKQINLYARIQVICIIVGLILGKIYLAIHPIA